MYIHTCKAWHDEQDWGRWVVETGLGDVFPVQGNLPTILQHNKLSDKEEMTGGQGEERERRDGDEEGSSSLIYALTETISGVVIVKSVM